MTQTTVIPFGGFYGSIWDREIDRIEDRNVGNLSEDWPDLEEGIWDVLNKHTDYSAVHLEVAGAYAAAFRELLNEELGLSLMFEFKDMTSPREYNFETDRNFCEVSLDDITELYEHVGRGAVAEVAKEMFTSRSGFASFYDPDIDTWGELEDWDHNQCLAIFRAAEKLLDQDYEYALLEDLSETISNAYDNNVAWVAVERDLQHLLDVQNGEAEVDARQFPPGTITSMQVYVQKFSELNHHKEGV